MAEMVSTKISKRVWIRNFILLAASYVFYGWFGVGFLALLVGVTAVNYLAGLCIEKYPHRGKLIVGLAVCLSVLPLLTYKYFAPFCFLIGLPLGESLILPVGLSFFTFQALTYTIDLYRGKEKICRSPLDFALFVAFFPTVLSGPIEKARNLLPQIKRLGGIDISNVSDGAFIFICGLFKKIVIADRLASYVDWVYSTAAYRTSGTLILAAIFYSIQIYCDFSGYSDMARGVAKSLGFEVTQNFRFPYFARSIKEFWRRWHISLTSWFTEYVYFSLGGSRVARKWQWMLNISAIFLLSGVWHGSSWGFVIWGAIHAVLYLTEHFLGLQNKDRKFNVLTSAVSTFAVFVIVTLAWVFFRADSLSMSMEIFRGILSFDSLRISTGASSFTFACNIVLLLVFAFSEYMIYKGSLMEETSTLVLRPQNAVFIGCLLMIMMLMSVSADKFVYFQF